jgi:hypothetical protein
MSRVKGAKDGTVITVKFNGKGKALPLNVSPKALMLLSIVGNEYCAGKYLEASTELATKDYDFTTFLIADEVYWHNLKQNDQHNDVEISILKENALRLGDNYFKTNFSAFLAPFDIQTRHNLHILCENKTVNEQIAIINQEAKSLPKKFEIVRWQDWVKSETLSFNYKEKKVVIEQLYQELVPLKNTIEQTASDFAVRHKKEGNENLWRLRSIDYLTEESPAVIILAAALQYNFIIYPGDMIPPFQATKDFINNDNPLNLKDPLNIPWANSDTLINWLQPYFTKSNPKTNSISQTNTSTAVATGQLKPVQVEDLQKNIGFFASKSPEIHQTNKKLSELVERLFKNNPADKRLPENVINTVKEIAPTLFSLSAADRLETIQCMNSLIKALNELPIDDPYNTIPLNPIKK